MQAAIPFRALAVRETVGRITWLSEGAAHPGGRGAGEAFVGVVLAVHVHRLAKSERLSNSSLQSRFSIPVMEVQPSYGFTGFN